MIHIVMASDNNYMRHLAVAASSCLANTKEDVTLHALLNNVSEENKAKLRQTFRDVKPSAVLHIIDTDNSALDNFGGKRYISTATYLRFFIPELLPKDIDKVLYLDDDILVRHDIGELYNTDISDYPIGAVRDRFMERKYYRRYGIAKGTPVFNAGIMLINLKNWRETGIHKKALAYSAETGLNDQISLNKLLAGNWLGLDYKWNMVSGYYRRYYNYAANKIYQFPFDNVPERIKDPYILHTTGGKKLSDYSYKYLFADEYFRYLDMTPWRDYKPADVNLFTVIDRVYNRVRIKIIDAVNKRD